MKGGFSMKMIVGLGNPGRQYEKTRHNTGYIIVDAYLDEKHPTWKKKFQSLYYETIINKEKVLFVKPETYMNNSGEAVASFANFYKIDASDILIICDDLDQPLGKYRLRSHGSCGGHNGLRNIEQHLKTQDYNRLRVGILTEKKEQIDTIDYVLGKFDPKEQEVLTNLTKTLKDVIDDYIVFDFTELMNKYNRRK